MPTLLGIGFTVVAVILGLQGKYRWILSLGAAVPIGVMTNYANLGVPVFYFFAIGVVLTLLVAKRDNLEPRKLPAKNLLTLFACWCVFVTLLSPGLFAGIAVLNPSGGIDSQLLNPSALTYTTSNVAQTVYLILGIGVVFYLGKIRGLSSMFLSGALGGLTLLSSARLASMRFGTPFPQRFFDNSTGVAYVEGTADGMQRFRGIFAEPSELAIASLVAVVFFLATAPTLQGVKKLAALGVAGLAVVNMVESTATSALASAVVFGAVFCTYHCVRFFFLGGRVRIRTLILAPLALPLIAVAGPTALSAVVDTVTTKVGTNSFGVRTGSDVFSIDVFMDTWGLGAGLGSNRPSSFVTMLLSNVGVVGAVLFLAAVIILLRKAWAIEEVRPAAWALIALLVSKSLASPNLSDPLIWITVGVLANAVWAQIPRIPKDEKLPPHLAKLRRQLAESTAS